MRRQHAIN